MLRERQRSPSTEVRKATFMPAHGVNVAFLNRDQRLTTCAIFQRPSTFWPVTVSLPEAVSWVG